MSQEELSKYINEAQIKLDYLKKLNFDTLINEKDIEPWLKKHREKILYDHINELKKFI